MSAKRFTNVADAAAHLADDPEMARKVTEEIERNELVAVLLENRVSKGLTQENVAESMGVDASTISRIESGNDRQLKWEDIAGYVNALKLRMNIMLDDPSWPAAERIKHCVFRIHDDLENLASLAHSVDGDEEITNGIARFYKDVLFNFLVGFKASHDKLSGLIKIPAPEAKPLAKKTETSALKSEELPPSTSLQTAGK